jgi:hypothetical protein
MWGILGKPLDSQVAENEKVNFDLWARCCLKDVLMRVILPVFVYLSHGKVHREANIDQSDRFAIIKFDCCLLSGALMVASKVFFIHIPEDRQYSESVPTADQSYKKENA